VNLSNLILVACRRARNANVIFMRHFRDTGNFGCEILRFVTTCGEMAGRMVRISTRNSRSFPWINCIGWNSFPVDEIIILIRTPLLRLSAPGKSLTIKVGLGLVIWVHLEYFLFDRRCYLLVCSVIQLASAGKSFPTSSFPTWRVFLLNLYCKDFRKRNFAKLGSRVEAERKSCAGIKCPKVGC